MLESLAAVVAGLHQVLMWPTIGFLVAGVLIGYVVGILPGLGGPAALAFMLPVVIPLAPLDGFVLLTATASVAAGAGDITSILLGVPGEATAAAIVADGHALALRGEGGWASGAAIAAALMGSLVGVGVLVAFVPFAQPLLRYVSSPALAALAILGICLLVPLSRADPIKGLLGGALGIALATIGLDPSSAQPRFTFAQLSLWDGLGLLPVALGIFAVPEALDMIRGMSGGDSPSGPTRGVIRGMREAVRHAGLVCRCSAIGAAIGILPGVGASVSQWIAYAHASHTAKGRDDFGSGAIEGVIGPASATTATHGGAMVPTLALGIPGGLTSSFLLSALILKGIVPGPTMLLPSTAGGHLTLVFALVWCMVIASAVGAVIGMASLGWVAGLARVRPARLFPLILTLVLVGTVGERHATADLIILLALGCLGYTMSTLKWPRAPMMLGFILGPLIERRVLLSNSLYGWSWVLRPGVLTIAAGSAAFLLVSRRSTRSGSGIRRVRPVQPQADALMSLFLGTLGAAGLGLSLWLTGRSSFFPRVAFGLMLGLSIWELTVSWRVTRSAQPPLPRTRPGTLARIAWFGGFVVSAWLFGLVIGTLASVFIYLRWDARESWPTTLTMTGALGLLTWLLAVYVMQLPDHGLL